MSEFEEALEKIFKTLEDGGKTKPEEWSVIMDKMIGADDVETINNIY